MKISGLRIFIEWILSPGWRSDLYTDLWLFYTSSIPEPPVIYDTGKQSAGEGIYFDRHETGSQHYCNSMV